MPPAPPSGAGFVLGEWSELALDALSNVVKMQLGAGIGLEEPLKFAARIFGAVGTRYTAFLSGAGPDLARSTPGVQAS